MFVVGPRACEFVHGKPHRRWLYSEYRFGGAAQSMREICRSNPDEFLDNS